MLLALGGSPGLWAGEPTDVVKQGTDRILEAVKDPNLKGTAKTAERRKLLYKIADDYFDWDEMARRSMSIYWAERTPEEKKQFVAVFSDLLARSYVGKIEGYKNQKILYGAERIDGEYAIVETKIITERDVEVPIHYRLRKKGSRWLAYDISIEGVSLVNNYRTQFNKILTSSSFSELIKRMKTKQLQEEASTGLSD